MSHKKTSIQPTLNCQQIGQLALVVSEVLQANLQLDFGDVLYSIRATKKRTKRRPYDGERTVPTST
ncbi:hypothetical protein EBR66_00365 [bacterium]|nr:hypothetical protein [bacterium]